MGIIRSKVAMSPRVEPSLRIAAQGSARRGDLLRLVAGTVRVTARLEASAILREPTP